jgi:hypothetical protein
LDGSIDGSLSAWSSTHRGSSGTGAAEEKSGIGYTLRRMAGELRWLDEEVWRSLKDKGVKGAYYAVRWLTTMVTGEWELPELCRVW